MDKYKVLLVLLTIAFQRRFASFEKPLYFSLMVPSDPSMIATGIVYAVNNALVNINNSSTLLTSDKLLYINEDPLEEQVYACTYRIYVREGERRETLMNCISVVLKYKLNLHVNPCAHVATVYA